MKKLLVLFLLISTLFGCNTSKNGYEKYVKPHMGFDTIIYLTGYTTSEEEFNVYADIMVNLFTEYNQLFDKYNDYEGINNIKTINDNAGKNKVTVEQPIIDLLLLAKEYSTITNGTFDITMGNTMSVWHSYRDIGEALNSQGNDNVPLPTNKELTESSKYRGWEYVEIDDKNNTVYITKEKVSLDVGAIAKGYTTEIVAQEIEKAGLKYGNVNGGGNIRLIGSKPEGANWGVGITNPNDPFGNGCTAYYVDKNMSIVTSGDYQRYFISNGTRYSHILDPSTLYPATTNRSVTIITENSAVADILSTALFVMNFEEGQQFVKDYNKKYPNTTLGVVWVYDLDNHPESSLGKEMNGVYVIATENIQHQVNGFME